jgi:hypothetical protein
MRKFMIAAVWCLSVALTACGGGGGSSSDTSTTAASNGSGSASNPSGPVQNTMSVTVGPNVYRVANSLSASVTICVPGTTNCQTINNILVDTGSYGLRLMASAVTVPLPKVSAAAGGTLATCAAFGSGTTFGSVARADVKLAGEVASSTPVQIIGDSSVGTSPADCTNQGAVDLSTAQGMGSNGILGVGLEGADCGPGCVVNTYAAEPAYFGCTSTASCVATTVALADQVTNPVSMFAADNNGVLIQLPAVATGGTQSVTGTLTFGIGTQSDNALGSATVYTLDAQNRLSTQYRGSSYANAFIDSGSNGLFFDDSSITQCAASSTFYCPLSNTALSAVMAGANGKNTALDFTIGNFNTMATSGAYAMSALGGFGPGVFDWGLPFFFGRTIYTAIDGKSTSGGTGPYYAF